MWKKGLIIGLSGVSCGGKTTVSKLLQASFPWASVIHQDAYFHPNEPKYHVLIPEINHYNWDLKSALDLKKMERDLFALISADNKESSFAGKTRFFPNDHFVNKHRPEESTVNYLQSQYSSLPLTIIEGHIIFNHKPFYELCDLRFFFTLDEEECRKRRELRVYDPPNPKGFFDKCVWPTYTERLKEVQLLSGIKYLDAKTISLIDIYKQIFTNMTSAMENLKGLSEKTDDAIATGASAVTGGTASSIKDNPATIVPLVEHRGTS